MSSVEVINPPSFGRSNFPISQATVGAGIIFLAGQCALDENNDIIAPGDSYAQGKAVIDRVRVILAEAGATLSDICFANIYYSSAAAAEGFNRAWVEELGEHRPARSAVVAELLVPEAAVEIQAFAVRPRAC
jgi:2-iminobutanoate/2-iminopropanoate deaminase